MNFSLRISVIKWAQRELGCLTSLRVIPFILTIPTLMDKTKKLITNKDIISPIYLGFCKHFGTSVRGVLC